MEDTMAHFTTKQLKQLLEIDSAGPGIRAEVQELISRLTSGGVGAKTDDPREAQAKKLWDKGFGRELGIESFDAYLATIPGIPEYLTEDETVHVWYPELVLVDARLDIEKICELLGIIPDFNQTFEDFDPKKARTEKVYWVRLQDGKLNRNKSVQTCREKFKKYELGLTLHEGLAFFAQNPGAFLNWAMAITGSVNRSNRNRAAQLSWFHDRPKLFDHNDGREVPDAGSGYRLVTGARWVNAG